MKVPATLEFEKKLWSSGRRLVAGIDEVGRGSWAGPVVAAAVVFPRDFKPDFEIFDSKLLTPKTRKLLNKKIRQVANIGIGEVDVQIIDKIGIGKASQKAFKRAVNQLPYTPNYYLIDAFYIPNWTRKNQLAISKGDCKCVSIAAASIVAKVFRDNLMEKLDSKYPGYDFSIHKGYGTKRHQENLRTLSFSPIHRRSFDLAAFVS